MFTYLEEDLQDVGIWLNEKIVQTCLRLPIAFTFENFLQHSINSGEKQIDDSPREEKKSKKKKKKKEPESPVPQVDWEMDDEILSLAPTNFQYRDIVLCLRDNFKPKGPLETMSEKLICASSEGDVVSVEVILRQGNVHPDVTDRTGFGALLAAVVS